MAVRLRWKRDEEPAVGKTSGVTQYGVELAAGVEDWTTLEGVAVTVTVIDTEFVPRAVTVDVSKTVSTSRATELDDSSSALTTE